MATANIVSPLSPIGQAYSTILDFNRREEQSPGEKGGSPSDNDTAHRDQLATDAPQVVASSGEKGEHLPTVVSSTTGPPPYDPNAHSPEVNQAHSPLFTRFPQNPNAARESTTTYGGATAVTPTTTVDRADWSSPGAGRDAERQPPPAQPRIFGLRPRSFWILLAVVLFIIIAAGVAGGVGGALANRDSGDDDSAPARRPRPPLPPTAVASSSAAASDASSSTTAHHAATPTPEPHMHFEMHLWQGQNYTGPTQVFYEPGGYELGFIGRSYSWEIGAYVEGEILVCSVVLCKGGEWLGWIGSTSKESVGHLGDLSWGPDNIFIKCSDNFADPGCRGPLARATFDSNVPVITPPPASDTPSRTRTTEAEATTRA